ncbi:MAG: PEP-utilizing enzyme [Candidatus Paceibacterota bacterium]
METSKYFKIRKRYLPTAWPTYNYWVSMEKITGVKSSIFHVWEKDGIYTGIVDAEGLRKRGEWTYKHIIENYKDNLDALRDRGQLFADKLIKECSIFALKDESPTLKQFSDFYKKADKLYIDYYANNMLFWLTADQVVIKKIDSLLSNYSSDDKKEIWDIMRLPTRLSFSNIEEVGFEKLLDIAHKDGIKSDKFKEQVALFSDKYVWFPFEYGGPEIYDIESVTRRISEELTKGGKKNSHSEQEIINLQNDVISKFSLSHDVVFHFKILQTLALMQDDRKAVNSQACYYVNNLILKKLSMLTGIDREQLFLIDQKIIDEYSNTQDFSELKRRIIKRNEMFVIFLNEDDGFTFKEGIDECNNFLGEFSIYINETITNQDIKGKVAYPGKVRGIARVVKKSGDCVRLNQNEILVTYMTTPDFAPFLKKVSAIVTEEGGITCHAAIVAREFKIPCITGTGNVMSVVKDGDMVEVDAEKGIVRIIK